MKRRKHKQPTRKRPTDGLIALFFIPIGLFMFVYAGILNPTNIRNILAGWIFGLPAAWWGSRALTRVWVAERKRRDLVKNGKAVEAEVQWIRRHVEGYDILLSWVDPTNAREYTFCSDLMLGNPIAFLKDASVEQADRGAVPAQTAEKDLETIRVYIDPKDPSRYFVDIRRLMKKRKVERSGADVRLG